MKKSKAKKLSLFKIQIPTKPKQIEALLGTNEFNWLYLRSVGDLTEFATGVQGDEEEIKDLGIATKKGQYSWVLNEIQNWIDDMHRLHLENMKQAYAKADADVKKKQARNP